jgi:hypothetical protein
MIMSVSILTTGSGAATPVSFVNFSMICLRKTLSAEAAIKQNTPDLKGALPSTGTPAAQDRASSSVSTLKDR